MIIPVKFRRNIKNGLILVTFLLFLLRIISLHVKEEITIEVWHERVPANPCGQEDIGTSRGCILESSHDPLRPVFMSSHPRHCDFFDENFVKPDCSIESDMHEEVKKMITSNNTVLELGGRYGTTSCAIASLQNNS